jgi:hypothetical protein
MSGIRAKPRRSLSAGQLRDTLEEKDTGWYIRPGLQPFLNQPYPPADSLLQLPLRFDGC